MVSLGREDVRSGPRVPQWYGGHSVLVTGATSFLGMTIVEKLLRSCPDIGTIYMLARPKRGLDPQERLEDYVSNVLFSKVRGERPDYARHMSVIAGDVSSPDFRLSEHDMAAMRHEVSVVFHCAANVRFDDSLHHGVITNVVGTNRLLQLADLLPNLQVFLYISTSFCHSDHQAAFHTRLLGNLPNTYAFTKNLTEKLVATYRDRLPIVIARPSIGEWE
ncbi:fatty acyl-CoA reductase 1-like [Schistocerca americana]|uniref:fatty acyl-CoA reductase 1-like n=1 Tax=Schistocerca americana TaxID=7009 RepID=UPI001F4F9AB4|nr:fatty acyl-CoA reductase 1-like [Schistocerca americana]